MSDDWQVVEEGLFQHEPAALPSLARLREREAREKRSEWREGIVNVLDHEGNYLGCLGSETWEWTLDGGIKALREREAQLEREKADADATWGQMLAEKQDRVARLEEALRLFVPTGVEGGYVLLTKDDIERVDTALAHEETRTSTDHPYLNQSVAHEEEKPHRDEREAVFLVDGVHREAFAAFVRFDDGTTHYIEFVRTEEEK